MTMFVASYLHLCDIELHCREAAPIKKRILYIKRKIMKLMLGKQLCFESTVVKTWSIILST